MSDNSGSLLIVVANCVAGKVIESESTFVKKALGFITIVQVRCVPYYGGKMGFDW